jgi:hypothetical protein
MMNPEAHLPSIIVDPEAFHAPEDEKTGVFRIPSETQATRVAQVTEQISKRRINEGFVQLKTLIAEALQEVTDPEDESCLEGALEALSGRDVARVAEWINAADSLPASLRGQILGQLHQWAEDMREMEN